MSIYPPPPPGWDSPSSAPPPSIDPAAADRALAAWAQTRSYALQLHPDATWYRAWAPFAFLFRPALVGREVRAPLGDAHAWVVELAEHDPTDRYVVTFITSPRLVYRGALRSRLQKEAVEELRASFNPRPTPRASARWRWRERETFLRRTYGRAVRGVIGDSIFEAHYEIATPTREEGSAAFPVAMRHLLVHGGWRGILELRPGGLVIATYGPPLFDPRALDATLGLAAQIYATAVRIEPPVSSASIGGATIASQSVPPSAPRSIPPGSIPRGSMPASGSAPGSVPGSRR